MSGVPMGVRRLHVLELPDAFHRAGSDAAGVACALDRGEHDAVVVVGATGAAARAERLGLSRVNAVCPMGRGVPWRLAPVSRGVRRVWRERGPFAQVVAWTSGALAACEAAGLSPVDRSGLATLEGASTRAASMLWGQGRAAHEQSRQALRAKLGLSMDEPAVCLLAERPDELDLAEFAYLAGLLEKAGVCVAGFADRCGVGRDRARSLVRRVPLRMRWSMLEEPVVSLMPAFDAACVLPPPARSGVVSPVARGFLAGLAREVGVRVVMGPEAGAIEPASSFDRVAIARRLVEVLPGEGAVR